MKVCSKCKIEQPLDCFSRNSTAADGKFCWCKQCSSLYSKARRERDPQRHRDNFKTWAANNKDYHRNHKKQWNKDNPHKSRQYALKGKFGVTESWYIATLTSQDGRCAICGSERPGGKGGKHFAIDHDHVSSVVRGLLCSFCNAGLGHFRDDSELLAQAIAYLAKHGR